MSNQGSTSGPMSDDDVRQGIAEGKITRGMHVRDGSGTWTPIEQSPFVALLPKASSSGGGAVTGAMGCMTIVTLLGAIWLFESCGDESETPEVAAPEDPREDAWRMCRALVKKQLKSPSTADFGGYGEQSFEKTISQAGPNEYRCSAWVDSQNSFGAMIRSNFDVLIRDNGDETWNLVSVESFEQN